MGRDKALLKLHGQTLLQRAVQLCKQTCSDIIISSNNPAHQISNIPVISDQIKNSGPLAGIYSCTQHAKTDWCFVISVDSPFVLPEFVEHLKKQANGFDAIVPVSEKGKEPLVALYNRSVLPVAERMIKQEQLRMHSFLSEVNTHFIEVNVWVKKHPLLFHNLNSATDANKIGLESF